MLTSNTDRPAAKVQRKHRIRKFPWTNTENDNIYGIITEIPGRGVSFELDKNSQGWLAKENNRRIREYVTSEIASYLTTE